MDFTSFLSCTFKFCFLDSVQRSPLFLVHKMDSLFFFFYLFFSLFLLHLWAQEKEIGWEECDEKEGEERSVSAWGDAVSSWEAVPVMDITMVVT